MYFLFLPFLLDNKNVILIVYFINETMFPLKKHLFKKIFNAQVVLIVTHENLFFIVFSFFLLCFLFCKRNALSNFVFKPNS